MKTVAFAIALAALFVSPATKAQQTPPPQPPQAHVQPAPCAAKPPAPKPPSGWRFRLPPKLQQAFNQRRAEIANKTGITVPQFSPDELLKQAQTPRPCPAQAPAVSAQLAAQTTPVTPKPAELKLPPDTSVTLKCNPMTPSPKGASGPQTSLTLPDPHDFAIPKPNQFEADSVVPDLAAKTPCFQIKMDPKTGKSFVAQ